MTDRGLNGLSQTARAFATYSLVPYLGILFCPGAVVVGTLGVIRSNGSERTTCLVSTLVGVVVLVGQSILWWLLYQVPVWALN